MPIVFLLVSSVVVGLVSYLTTRNPVRAVAASAVILFGVLLAYTALGFGG
ncbi:MAG: hypothetical protein M3P51_04750 [Chloroflexota bacterium]|nr:hypothetical protein [Chloroflexota bacterium]